MPPKPKNQITDEQVVQAASELIKSGVSIESADLSEEMRARVRSLVSGGEKAGPEAQKPPTREQLIDKLGLRSQYENRADHMVYLVGKDFFKLGKPIPTLEETLNSFTTEQLQFASTLQEPTLLLVPETSFAAKVKALDATKTIKGQDDVHVGDIFKQTDFGSENITGWKAFIVDGAEKMRLKVGDNIQLTLAERIAIRKIVRKLGGRGIDRHAYAMLTLKALRIGRLIDDWKICTLLDDDLALTKSHVPYAFWVPGHQRVIFQQTGLDSVDRTARFRSSVGGDMEL